MALQLWTTGRRRSRGRSSAAATTIRPPAITLRLRRPPILQPRWFIWRQASAARACKGLQSPAGKGAEKGRRRPSAGLRNPAPALRSRSPPLRPLLPQRLLCLALRLRPVPALTRTFLGLPRRTQSQGPKVTRSTLTQAPRWRFTAECFTSKKNVAPLEKDVSRSVNFQKHGGKAAAWEHACRISGWSLAGA